MEGRGKKREKKEGNIHPQGRKTKTGDEQRHDRDVDGVGKSRE